LITDSEGNWLARNKADFALALYPSDLPKKAEEREQIYGKLAELSGKTAEEIRNKAEENGLLSINKVILKDNLEHNEALLLKKRIVNIQGAVVAEQSRREYITIPGLSHLLGYTSLVSKDDLVKNPTYLLSDKIGRTGLEATYEKYLKGQNGVEQIEVDSKGNIVRTLVQEDSQHPVAGDDISLYLNSGLQQKTAEALLTGIQSAKELTENKDINSGVAIVMDVNNGGILSMVSLPSYDDNLFSGTISKENYQALVNDKSLPMFNRAIAGTYPPGSVSKIILAAAGLAEGTITRDTSMVTPAAITIGEWIFPDWKDHSYESTNIVRAIAESNNVFFYSVGGGYENIKGLGIERIKKYWQIFGLGSPTGIELTGEASGLLPDPDWKERVKNEPWYIGDTYHVAIGQGDLLVTPLQMIRVTAAIANGGKLIKPPLVKKKTDNIGNVIKEYGPVVQNSNVASPEVIKTVQEGMRLTVTGGSARNLADLPVSVAGKTGTAQFLDNQKTHAWFECYAPYENPEIAVVVLIEGGGGGREIAAPVAKDILNYYFTR
jgi:penicillin-binding protein 2